MFSKEPWKILNKFVILFEIILKANENVQIFYQIFLKQNQMQNKRKTHTHTEESVLVVKNDICKYLKPA